MATILGMLIVIGFYRGELYPRKVVEMLKLQHEKQLQSERERADKWEASWYKQQEARALESAGDREMALKNSELAYRALSTIQNQAQNGEGS